MLFTNSIHFGCYLQQKFFFILVVHKFSLYLHIVSFYRRKWSRVLLQIMEIQILIPFQMRCSPIFSFFIYLCYFFVKQYLIFITFGVSTFCRQEMGLRHYSLWIILKCITKLKRMLLLQMHPR